MFTVTVERPGGTDRFGNPLPAVTHTVDDCWDAPPGSTGLSSEEHHTASTVEWDLDLYARLGSDFQTQDVVLIPGDTTRYQVHGRPRSYKAPSGWEAGMIVRLKAVA